MARLLGNQFVAVLLTLTCLCVRTGSSDRASVLVNLPQGSLRGEWINGEGGTSPYAAFRGIPYAAPPTGQLRYRGPRPALPWKGERDASKEGPKCPHFTVPQRELVGQEDCLYLNIYTPYKVYVPAFPGLQTPLVPVMVYIHGGGFTYGSGTETENGPDFLVDHGVVLVTLNYRLGALGFLSLDTESVPGNAGLKDQRAALKWVQDNIAYFGGDPRLVTIFGNSAGAASAHLHTLVPASKGLFGAAILQGGNALASFAYTEIHPKRAARLASFLGVTDSNPGLIEKALRAASTPEILNATLNMILSDPVLQLGYPPFPPTPERRKRGFEEIFLPQDPESLVFDPLVEPVPMIAGINSREGLFAFHFGGLAALPDGVVTAITQNVSTLLPLNLPPAEDTAAIHKVDFVGDLSPEQRASIAKRVQEEYFGKNATTVDDFIELLSDLFTVTATHRLGTMTKTTADAPLYLYRFDVDGEYNWGKKIFNITRPGVCHTDELGYLLRITDPELEQDLRSGSDSAQKLWLLSSMWTNFAKYRNPLPADYSAEIWRPVRSLGSDLEEDYWTNAAPYLNIGRELQLCSGLGGRRMKLWDDVYNSLRSSTTDPSLER